MFWMAYRRPVPVDPVRSNGLPRILMAAFRALVIEKGLPGFGYPSIEIFAASESLNGFLEALRPDLLVFPFAQQEFDRSWRRRESLWHFSIRALRYKRTRSAVLVPSPVPRYGCCRLAPWLMRSARLSLS